VGRAVQGRIEDVTLAEPASRSFRVDGVDTAIERGSSARAQYRRLFHRVAVTDVLSIAVALMVASWVRFGFATPPMDFLVLVSVVPFAMVVVYAAFHLYDAYRFTPAEEFRRIILAVSLGVGGVFALSFWSKAEVSRLWLALTWAFAAVAALSSRRLWHAKIGREKARGNLAFPTLIVGTNAEAVHLSELMASPSFGFRALGMVRTEEGGESDRALPVMGTVADLREVIREAGVECVFVAASALSVGEMKHVAKAVRLEGVEVRVTATLPEVLSSRVNVQSLGGVTALSLRPVRLSGTQAALKRAFDVALAGLGTLLLSPALLALSLAVKVSSPGPVFYRQTRVGQRGRPFTMLKFRTMRVGAEAMVQSLREEHGVDDLMFKLENDPRVTRLGRALRRYSLDELPQLINVILGNMSLVGPRPPLPEEVTRYEDWQFDRLEVPPGVTGLWQVSGRSKLSFDDCVRLDLFYIENWSLAYDLYILAKTAPVLISRRGAY
jgi:exopolysaccharide biosynthesis polyprenyl glycosylphosphotransferase